MAKIDEIELTQLQFAEGAAPASPSAGVVKIYAKTDGLLYSKDSAGTEICLGKAGGSAPPAAGAEYRGMVFNLEGGTGVADILKVCMKKADDTYDWLVITTT